MYLCFVFSRVILTKYSQLGEQHPALLHLKPLVRSAILLCDLWVGVWGVGFWSGWIRQTLGRLETILKKPDADVLTDDNIDYDIAITPTTPRTLPPIEKLVRPGIKARKTQMELLDSVAFVPRRGTRIRKVTDFYKA